MSGSVGLDCSPPHKTFRFVTQPHKLMTERMDFLSTWNYNATFPPLPLLRNLRREMNFLSIIIVSGHEPAPELLNGLNRMGYQYLLSATQSATSSSCGHGCGVHGAYRLREACVFLLPMMQS